MSIVISFYFFHHKILVTWYITNYIMLFMDSFL